MNPIVDDSLDRLRRMPGPLSATLMLPSSTTMSMSGATPARSAASSPLSTISFKRRDQPVLRRVPDLPGQFLFRGELGQTANCKFAALKNLVPTAVGTVGAVAATPPFLQVAFGAVGPPLIGVPLSERAAAAPPQAGRLNFLAK